MSLCLVGLNLFIHCFTFNQIEAKMLPRCRENVEIKSRKLDYNTQLSCTWYISL